MILRQVTAPKHDILGDICDSFKKLTIYKTQPSLRGQRLSRLETSDGRQTNLMKQLEVFLLKSWLRDITPALKI